MYNFILLMNFKKTEYPLPRCTFVAASRFQGFVITVGLYCLVLILQFVEYVLSLMEFTRVGLSLKHFICQLMHNNVASSFCRAPGS